MVAIKHEQVVALEKKVVEMEQQHKSQIRTAYVEINKLREELIWKDPALPSPSESERNELHRRVEEKIKMMELAKPTMEGEAATG